MTLFEYISVAIAIVVSFGVVRLLDGFSHAVDRDRRYWPHLVWVGLKLLQHFNVWWLLWASRDVSWDYGRFLAQLGPPLILYLQATALVTSSPQSVESWRAHFYAVRRRFFGLNFFFGFSFILAGLVAAGPEVGWIPPLQAVANAVGIAAISTVGLMSDSHRVHSAPALFVFLSNLGLVAQIHLTLTPVG